MQLPAWFPGLKRTIYRKRKCQLKVVHDVKYHYVVTFRFELPTSGYDVLGFVVQVRNHDDNAAARQELRQKPQRFSKFGLQAGFDTVRIQQEISE